MENPALDSEAERPSLSDMNILVMALGAALLGLHSGALRAEPNPQPFPSVRASRVCRSKWCPMP